MLRNAVLLALALTSLAATADAAVLHRAEAEHIARARVASALPTSIPDCLAPAGDPEPGSDAWNDRDTANQYCANERLLDEYGSPAFGSTFWSETPGIFVSQNVEMLMNPTHPHATLAQFVIGGTTTDPYRTIERWVAAGRGRVDDISFTATDGATLNGHIFRPPAPAHGKPKLPGVVITTGSIQGYQEMYYWAAEGLAEAGYEVMTYDVQGQGQSDTFGADCAPPNVPSGQCEGVPFQQSYNFYQGTEDALNFFFSKANPGRDDLDPDRVGIAGHSLGASAVSEVGQCDPRVKAIVAWDKLASTTGKCADKATGFPKDSPASPTLKVPGLGIHSEYFFNTTSQQSAPDAQAHAGAFKQLRGAGTDAMVVELRSSTHLEYTYVAYNLPASRVGERVAMYYTLAWLDRYVKGDDAAFDRLTAKTFDASADASSIGAGTYDANKAAAAPTDTTAGNVPYTIKGLPVRDRVSIYYMSQYGITAPEGGTVTCVDMRKDCPAGPAPATP
jgi:dienelactone hydrolase